MQEDATRRELSGQIDPLQAVHDRPLDLGQMQGDVQ
jgi:hypothetical protein